MGRQLQHVTAVAAVAVVRYDDAVLTVGVDLAAEAVGTAVAVIESSTAGVVVRDLILPGNDDTVIDAVQKADKAGIDCPLGWPDAFVSFVSAHRLGAVALAGGAELGGKAWRRGLAWRHTDEVVREATGMVPLSVAADRIAHTALRCAVIQARLATLGVRVDRSGAGTVVEVYPAASLKIWNLPWRDYKKPTGAAARAAIVAQIETRAPWLSLGGHADQCRRSDHALDALVAALTALACAQE